jgi:class I fructose-bisphosphate aldolase
VGYTIYPGSDRQYEMFEEVRAAAAEARASGLVVVVWAYPRGGAISEAGETALDIVAYGAQIAAQLGAHIIKVKLPTAYIETAQARSAYEAMGTDFSTLANRVAHVVQAAFAGRRMVVFSGGSHKNDDDLLLEAQAILAGGGSGSIIGRNSFQRSRADAVAMLRGLADIYIRSAGPDA